MDIEMLKCPYCGAALDFNSRKCEYCQNPVIITSFSALHSIPLSNVKKYANLYKDISQDNNSWEASNSLAMCYLKMGMYDMALKYFEKSMQASPENSETYFWAAVALLKGAKPFTLHLTVIKKIIQYVQAANMLEERGIYHYFLAYVKYDYFERKYLKISPNYKQELNMSVSLGVTEYDIEVLKETLGRSIPSVLKIN